MVFTKISCCTELILSDVLLASSGLGLCPHMLNLERKKANKWQGGETLPHTQSKRKNKVICKVLCCISALEIIWYISKYKRNL